MQVVEDGEPELGALGVLPPDPQRFAVAVDGDADRQIAGAGAHGAVLADLHVQRVEVDDRVHALQRPRPPGGDVLQDGVGDAADGVAADLNAVEALQVRGDVTDAHAARVEVQHPVIQAGQPGLALADELRLERPPRSRGVRTSTGPRSVWIVLPVWPLRWLPAPPGAWPGG